MIDAFFNRIDTLEKKVEEIEKDLGKCLQQMIRLVKWLSENKGNNEN